MEKSLRNEPEEFDGDINDAFDFVAFPEDEMSNEGFQEGLSKGKHEGKIEGYHLGYHRGLEIGREIGFYKGVIKGLDENPEKIKFKNNEKIYKSIEKLNDLLRKFPKNNSEDVDITSSVSEIRVHYRKLVSLLKLNLLFPINSDMSF